MSRSLLLRRFVLPPLCAVLLLGVGVSCQTQHAATKPATQKTRLESISGTVPNLLNPPLGCRFAARCKFAMPECSAAEPPLREVEPGHKVACIL